MEKSAFRMERGFLAISKSINSMVMESTDGRTVLSTEGTSKMDYLTELEASLLEERIKKSPH